MADQQAPDTAALRAEVDLLRRRVLNVVGHELRTPVTTVRGLAELVGQIDDPAKAADVLAALQRAARRVEALLDDALVALGVTAALPVGEPQATPVAAAVEAAWTSLGTGAPAPAIAGDAVALVHPTGLRSALRAVLDNAAKYGGGVSGSIEVRIADEDGGVLVEVADKGEGVPDAEAGLLFEPFFRTERAVMANAGLGLGLPVARRLVEHDGGTVELQSSEGAGVVATIRLRGVA